MAVLAPNVLAFLEDPNLTARLIASAGGIKELAQSSNIQVMGGYKKNTGAMSTQHAKLHRGIIAQSSLVKEASRQNERQMIRMLSTKCALAARVDMFGSKRDGSQGKRLRQGIIQRFKKITEAAPPRAKKPRKAPIEKAGTKRAGKRVFSQKKKYQQTQLRKRQNRLKFGTEAQDQYMNTGEGFGMIGKGGIGGGSLKITSQKNQKILRTRLNIERSSDAKSGLESNLNITPMSGISLINPEILGNASLLNTGGQTQKYFDSKSGFSTVIQDGLLNKK